MTNNTITVMKKELARFFGDRRLVITTLLLPGIMIYVVYSFLGSAMMKSILPERSLRGESLCGGYAGVVKRRTAGA